MTDVLLVVPPFTYGPLRGTGPACPSLGITTIAAVLEEAGYDVKILDAFVLGLSEEEIQREIEKTKPAILGITAATATFQHAINILKMAKEADPECKCIVGGPHVSSMPETMVNLDCVDYIAMGEGDYTALELVNYLSKGEGEAHAIKGIMYRDKDKIIRTEPRQFIEDLDELPIPAYHLLPMDKYRPYAAYDVGRKFSSMITSRGCPFRCTYCTSSVIFGHRWRARSADKAMDEINLLYEKFGIRHIYFQDDEFTINKQRTIDICKKITESGIDLVWECLARVNQVDEELITNMENAGCKGILYGIECGYQEGLQKIRKGITLEQAKKAVETTNKHHIQSKAAFMMGFPWEGAEEIRQTIDFAKSLNSDLCFFNMLWPFPGTEVYKEVEENHLIVSNDWESYVGHATTPVIRTKKLTAEEVSQWCGRAHWELYTRPGYILNRLMHMTNPTQLKRNIIAGMELITHSLRRTHKE